MLKIFRGHYAFNKKKRTFIDDYNFSVSNNMHIVKRERERGEERLDFLEDKDPYPKTASFHAIKLSPCFLI